MHNCMKHSFRDSLMSCETKLIAVLKKANYVPWIQTQLARTECRRSTACATTTARNLINNNFGEIGDSDLPIHFLFRPSFLQTDHFLASIHQSTLAFFSQEALNRLTGDDAVDDDPLNRKLIVKETR